MIRRRTTLLGAAALGGTTRIAGAADALAIALSSNTLAYGGLRIAEAAGLFQRHGLDPRIVVMDSGNAAISALVAGSVQVASSGPGEVLAARLRGREIVIVANLYRGLSGSLVLAKPVLARLGVVREAAAAQRLRALDGLTIAAPSATSAYLHPMKAAAADAGAKPRFTYMSQPAMVAALQAGAVQGIIAGAPFSLAAVANGSGIQWISGPGDDLPAAFRPASSACLQVTAEYARSHAPVLAALRAVSADVATLVQEKPADGKALLAKAFPQLDPASLDAAFDESARNWSQPVMTVADIRQEIRIQESSGAMPGVGGVDAASVVVGPE